jgi:hypothetical protein
MQSSSKKRQEPIPTIFDEISKCFEEISERLKYSMNNNSKNANGIDIDSK